MEFFNFVVAPMFAGMLVGVVGVEYNWSLVQVIIAGAIAGVGTTFVLTTLTS